VDALLHMGLSNAVIATLLAVLAATCSRLGRRPALTHALWLLVLVKLLTPSFVVFHMPWLDKAPPAKVEVPSSLQTAPAWPPEPDALARTFRASASGSEDTLPTEALLLPEPMEREPAVVSSESATSVVAIDADPAPAEAPIRSWIPILAGIWLAGSITWFSLVAYRIASFRRWLRSALPASPRLCEQAEQLTKRLGLASCPSVWLLPGRLSPMVWALGHRPRLLVPSALWDRLDAEQQAALLIHELAHVRRRDHWVRRLELLATVLYWWHPVVWWACRELHEAEEQCCDAWVVSTLPGAARAYAIALMETVDFLSETPTALPLVASGIGRVHDLRRRLTMIMHGKTPRALSDAGFWVVLGMGALLPLMPTWAQGPGEQPEVPAVEAPRPIAAGTPAVRVGEANATKQETPALESAPLREVPTPTARPASMKKERALLEKEVQMMKDQIERLQRQQQQILKRYEDAQKRLIALKEAEASGRPAEAVEGQIPAGPSPRREGRSDTERRLSALERKLDALLDEVQNLRSEMHSSGPGMMPGRPYPPRATPSPAPRFRQPGARPGYPGMPGSPTPAPALSPAPGQPAGPTVAPAAPAPAALPAPPGVAPLPPTRSSLPGTRPPEAAPPNEQPEASAPTPR
jgi:beta-lactamase regulating signal transducer with metallopeptidase domain